MREHTPPPDPKQAGVLVLLYPCSSQLCLPITRRTETVESHKGQVSLPGGTREGGEALEATAVRETCEELGVCPDRWDILGPLTPLYIPPSGFLVHPYVAYAPVRPAFRPDPVEVAELIEIPLSLLLDPATVVREDWLLRGSTVQVPFFYTYGHKVWGATAMVLSEFVAVLNEDKQ
jgi:8-oxo-dGTP pyrophosphatase MutT (NUDIX family)